MSFSALALLITAGFIHAGWNIVAKQAGGDARFALFTSLFLAVVWAPLGLWLASVSYTHLTLPTKRIV